MALKLYNLYDIILVNRKEIKGRRSEGGLAEAEEKEEVEEEAEAEAEEEQEAKEPEAGADITSGERDPKLRI